MSFNANPAMVCLFCGDLFRYKSMTSSVEVKNNYCEDDVSSTFLAVMRCSLFIYIFLAVLWCSGPLFLHLSLLTVATELVLLNWQVKVF